MRKIVHVNFRYFILVCLLWMPLTHESHAFSTIGPIYDEALQVPAGAPLKAETISCEIVSQMPVVRDYNGVYILREGQATNRDVDIFTTTEMGIAPYIDKMASHIPDDLKPAVSENLVGLVITECTLDTTRDLGKAIRTVGHSFIDNGNKSIKDNNPSEKEVDYP